MSAWLKTHGWTPVIINPIKTASLRNYGVRGAKTDNIDRVLIANTLLIEGEQPQTTSLKLSEELRQFTRLRADITKDRSSPFSR